MTAPRRVGLRRSYLFAPGNNAKLLGKVFDAGADAVVLDLEDAVPAAQKPEAREMVRAALAEREPGVSPGVFVRVNHPSTGWWKDDVAAVVAPALTGIRLPKVNGVQEVEKVADLLDEVEAAAGLERGSTPIVCTIESAVGVMNLERIARARRVVGFAYGASDLTRDLGAELVGDEIETLYVRSRLVLVSAALGLQPPIASVQTDLADSERLRATTRAARRLGFFGRSCIHPKQLPIVHEVFTPDPERVARARAVVQAYREHVAAGSGSFSMPDGQFVDEAIARQAEALVRLADSLDAERA
jgi:citrate lyase subunit beta/citryl-CoA lyase